MKNLIFLSFFFTSSLWAADVCLGLQERFPIVDPTDGQPFDVKAKIYRPIIRGKAPVVFILPPIVGETVLDRRLASRLCNSGIAAYILEVVKEISLDDEIPNLQVHDDSYVRALAGIRRVIAALQEDPHLQQEYGIIGTSLGGMLATYIAGSEPTIKASVIVVGAGNVPGVLAYSDQERVKAQRTARLKLFNLPDQIAYEKLLQNMVPNDPITVASQIRPGSSYLFIATKDTTVPTRYQRELRSKIIDPKVFEMNANHFEGIVKAGTLHAEKINRFFQLMLR